MLYSVTGLSSRELQREVLVQLGARTYKTLSPIALLKAKLANFVQLPQQTPGYERNDAKHIRVLVPCVAAYINHALQKVISASFTERSFVNLLEEILVILKSEPAKIASRSEEIDLMRCFPHSLRTTDLPKVQDFLRHRISSIGSGAGND